MGKESINRVLDFLKSLPYRKISSDGTQLTCRCPFCGDSRKDPTHVNFSIKIGIKDREPFLYKCFRADCGKSGILTTDTLQLLGCNDMETLVELANWNKTVSKRFEKGFTARKKRNYAIVNLKSDRSKNKLAYVNQRLGMNWSFKDLADYRIQLSIVDFIKGNNIKKLAYDPSYVEILDKNCVGFISMYKDYAILRDCTKSLVTKRRYHMYRTSGIAGENDTKVYAIPTEIDLLEPTAADINVAEGAFSILGAYLHTDLGRNNRNVMFMANCGSEYFNTIMSACAQYGLIRVNLHLWADSEIPISKFQKLLRRLNNHLIVESCHVYYNKAAEDFGQPGDKIDVQISTLM